MTVSYIMIVNILLTLPHILVSKSAQPSKAREFLILCLKHPSTCEAVDYPVKSNCDHKNYTYHHHPYFWFTM